MATGKLRITEIYASVQGESTHAGKPCVFIRLTGCDLRCRWCDSEYTFTGGETIATADVIAQAVAFGVHAIEITGGEPLLQKEVIPLMQSLLDLGHEVLIETGGHRAIDDIPAPVHVIMDMKAPGSGESAKNLWANVAQLRPHHEVKFVISSREDYDWAVARLNEFDLASKVEAVLFSPGWGSVPTQDLIEWIVADKLPVRLNLQIHKFIWDPKTTGV